MYFDYPYDIPELEQEFLDFHAANPHIWVLFKAFTQKAQESGRKHYSGNAIFERIRWHMAVETVDDSGFKLNNNHKSYYVRMYQAAYPNRANFFRTRSLKVERDPIGLDLFK